MARRSVEGARQVFVCAPSCYPPPLQVVAYSINASYDVSPAVRLGHTVRDVLERYAVERAVCHMRNNSFAAIQSVAVARFFYRSLRVGAMLNALGASVGTESARGTAVLCGY